MNVLKFLAENLPQNSKAIEIGVFKGNFSRRFIRRCSPEKFILIDPWAAVSDQAHKHAWYHIDRGNDMDVIYNDVITRMEKNIQSGVVDIHRATSSVILPTLATGTFDFIFIDGDHLYTPLTFDLNHSFKLMKVGGIMLIDDYVMSDKFWWGDDVIRATHDFLSNHSSQVRIEKIHENQILVRKTSS
jgi:predicted O-methyltransferase YrrM